MSDKTPVCGTDIEYEDFRSGGEEVVLKRTLPSVPENGLEVPQAAYFKDLVEILRTKSASDIVAILANREAEETHGPAESTIRNVASELEESDSKLAYSLHLANWEKFRDSFSLSRLIVLAFRMGNKPDAFRFARISRFMGENLDPFLLISEVDFRSGGALVESVLAGSIVEDPNRVRYLSDPETARFLSESRDFDEEQLKELVPNSKEAWNVRLRGFEYRGLTLLDPVAANSLVRTLAQLAGGVADIDTDPREFLAEYASSAPSMVAEAYYSLISEGHSVSTEDCASVGDMLYRRFAHAIEHFFDHRFIEFHRNLEALCVAMDHPESVHACRANVLDLEKRRDFYWALPVTVADFRNRLLGEMSDAYGSAFYPRLRGWTLGLGREFAFKNHGIAALILVEMLAKGDVPDNELEHASKQLAKLPVIPEIASMVAFAFAARSKLYEAAEWLSRSNLDDAENSGLLLRIVADYRDLPETANRRALPEIAIDAFKNGAPVTRPSAAHALSRVRSLVSKFPTGLAEEMLGDAEAAFGDLDNAVEHYSKAFEAGNADALKKAADLCYAMGRFKEAEEKYEFLYQTEHFPEVAPRLCLFACEKDDQVAAKKYFGEIDMDNPANADTIGEYYALTGELFEGLSAFSVLPPEATAAIPPDLLDGYRFYAETLIEKVSADGSRKSFKPEDDFAGELLWLRTIAFSFLRGPKDATRYFRYIRDSIRLSDDTALEDMVDNTVIGLLAPFHDPKLLAYANSADDELRAEAFVDLLADEAKTLAESYQEYASGDEEKKSEYATMLLAMSELFADYDVEVAGFFRDAGANATQGIVTEGDGIGNPNSAMLH